jgi:hypothetical protein
MAAPSIDAMSPSADSCAMHLHSKASKIAADESEQLGDTSSLADPAVVTDLVETHSRLHLPQAPGKQGK